MRSIALFCLLALAAMPALAASSHGYKVLERKPQARDLFVQGLQIVGDELYVSTGRYGHSRLLRYRFSDGELLQGLRLPPQLWGEGLTVLQGSIYQLTWKARTLLVYEQQTLQLRYRFTLPGEGWGITHNGSTLIYSDGSNQLHYLAPGNGRRLGSIAVTENGQPLPCLNELEWIDGRVWANVWLSNRIVMINPYTGVVEGSADLSGLLPESERQPETDVLNGIARDPGNGALWVTGKHWPWLYQLQLTPAPPAPLSPPPGSMQYNAEPAYQACAPFN